MKTPVRLLVTLLSAALLAACGGSLSPQSEPIVNSAGSAHVFAPTSTLFKTQVALYAANMGNNTVSIYGGIPMRFLRAVDVGRLTSEIAVDASGLLYVADDDQSGTVSIFSNRGRHLQATITQGIREPHAVALDGSGNIFVANFPNVNEYAAGSLALIRVIKGQEQHLLACDAAGNLYVSNGHAIKVYPPGATSPNFKISLKNYTFAMAFDSSGDLYVADAYANSVKVYAADSNTLLRTITAGISYPSAFAFDASGNLYVANYESQGQAIGNDVTVYAPGSSEVSRTLSDGMDFPDGLAFDTAGNLYVSNWHSNTINVYEPGGSSPKSKITHGVSGPSTLVFGP